jgi:hypothetical protein
VTVLDSSGDCKVQALIGSRKEFRMKHRLMALWECRFRVVDGDGICSDESRGNRLLPAVSVLSLRRTLEDRWAR